MANRIVSSAHKVKSWYLRHERIISSFALVFGFIFGAFTLTRADQFIENFWVITHLTIVSFCIIAINYIEKDEKEESNLHFWLMLFIQGTFGGLISTFLIFYFRSATLSTSWPFLLLLAILFICNEVFKKQYTRLAFQISFLFISVYAFTIYFLPVVLHQIGTGIFLLSGLVSLLVIFVFIQILRSVTREKFKENRWLLFGSITGIFLLINVLYFTHLIPPLPLSLHDAGVYHSLTTDGQGIYVATYEPALNWFQKYFSVSETYHEADNKPVYIYSAIFSPAEINTTIIHQWQYYDTAKKKWITTDTVNLGIEGGRSGGYRTYSLKSSVFPAEWRVNVLTKTGEYLGRIRFTIVESTSTPDLATEYLW